jgi:nitrogen fixation NifU-like protein
MDMLYQDKLLLLAQKARVSTPLSQADLTATLNNPVCGDRVTLSVSVSGAVITGVYVEVKGCALCEAGAGLLAYIAPEKTCEELMTVGTQMADWLTQPTLDAPIQDAEALHPVRAIKNRHKCVLLVFSAVSHLAPAEDTLT